MTIFLGGLFSIEKEIKNFFKKTLEMESKEFIRVTLTNENAEDEVIKINNYMKNPQIVYIYCYMSHYTHLLKIAETMTLSKAVNDDFRLFVFTKDNNKVISNQIFDICNFLNRENSTKTKNFKNGIIDDVEKIDEEVYSNFINKSKNINMARKLFFNLILAHNLLKKINNYNEFIINFPFNYNKRDLSHCIAFMNKYINDFMDREEPPTVVLFLLYCLEVFYGNRLVYKDDYNRFIKIILKFLDDDKFLNRGTYFFVGDNSFLNINAQDSHLTKEDVIRIFEGISMETYLEMFDMINRLIIYEEDCNFQKKIFNLFSQMNLQSYKEPEVIIDYAKSIDLLENIKNTLPEPINIEKEQKTPTFKLTKNGELVNMTDECLKSEINSYNAYLNMILEELSYLMSIFTNKVNLTSYSLNLIKILNNDVIPENWKNHCHKPNSKVSIQYWLTDLGTKFKFLRDWLSGKTPEIYEASYFYNFKYLLNNIILHYSKKYNINVESIVLKFLPVKQDIAKEFRFK